jgi:tetratricopeptide (TPR) repeat protein
MKCLASAILILAVATGCFAQAPAKAPLDFPATCSVPAHQRFIQGVIKLHNSAYAEAAEHFRAAEQLDPKCVLAFWGEAMTFNHPFWAEENPSAGRAALAKLGPTPAARAAKAVNARERGYLNAVSLLWGEGDYATRAVRYADAMAKVSLENPADYEAAAFHAAAILGTMNPLDTLEKDNAKRTAAAAILKRVLLKYPDHPGGLHYLIHADDTPGLAHLALDAARHYEKVADGNFHALHMPSHIYVQLGMWADAVRSNEAALAASPAAGPDHHSLEWLQYAEMQLGQYQKASSRTDTMLALAKTHNDNHINGVAAEMASRFAVETGDWDGLAIYPQNNHTPKLLFAQGLAALQSGDPATAKGKVATLDTLIQMYRGAGEKIRPVQADTLKRELSAKIAVSEKQFPDADRLASEAVQLESTLLIYSIMEQDGILKPATEFYGDILLDINKPVQAAEQFSATLKRTPKRAVALLGLARARVMQKDTPGAIQAYKELGAIWTNADATIPAVREVRAYVAAHP